MLSNSLKVIKLLAYWLNNAKPRPACKGRKQPFGSKIKGFYFPEKMLNQDIPRNIPVSSDLNIYPHSMEYSAAGTLKRDTNTKEKGSSDFLN